MYSVTLAEGGIDVYPRLAPTPEGRVDPELGAVPDGAIPAAGGEVQGDLDHGGRRVPANRAQRQAGDASRPRPCSGLLSF
jgi:hypothetical protein